jgi:hypothetical protein
MGPMESLLSDMPRLCGALRVSLQDNQLVTPAAGMGDFGQIKAALAKIFGVCAILGEGGLWHTLREIV